MAQTFTFAADLFTHSDLLCPFDPVALLQAMAADDPDDLDDDEEDEDDDEDEDEDDEDEDEDQEEEGGDDEDDADDADDDEDDEDEDLDEEDEGDEARSARGPLRRQNGHAAPLVRPRGPRMSRRWRR